MSESGGERREGIQPEGQRDGGGQARAVRGPSRGLAGCKVSEPRWGEGASA